MATTTDFPSPTLTVLLPVRNEEIHLPIMLKMLDAFLEVPFEVLAVYDDVNDRTIPVIERYQNRYSQLRGLLNTRGPGFGSAVRTGVEQARGKYVLLLGIDDIGPVLSIGDMLELMESGCEFVGLTRYAHGGRRLAGPWTGRWLSRLANRLLPWLAGSAFTDSTDAEKMFRREIFDQLKIESRDVGCVIGLEMAIKAQVLGLKLGEVPVISIDRPFGGGSNFRLIPWFFEYTKWFSRAVFRYGRQLRAHRGAIQVKASLFEHSLSERSAPVTSQ